jgi:alanine dehydrogenase
MNIGVPKERRPFEYRVGLTPAGVALFCQHDHEVYVESEAGVGAGFSDEAFREAGAKIVYSLEEVYGRSQVIFKFTRPMQDELEFVLPRQSILGFLHLAAARQDKLDILLGKEVTTIAYEQVSEQDGYRPIMAPLSQIGGQMAVQVAARLLQNDHGGRGILLGGVAGVPSAEVVILGAGMVGSTAAHAFSQAGAQVTVLDIELRRLQRLKAENPGPLVTMLSTPYNVARACAYADVLIGAVLVPGERTPLLVPRQVVASMKPRSVVLDLSIDQGGCLETSRPTNHGSPTFIDEGVLHYCVPNMSGVLGRTASHALFIGAFPYLERLAMLGVDGALEADPGFERGLNSFRGRMVHLKRPEIAGGQAS